MKPLLFFTLICLGTASLNAQTKLPLSPTPTLAELKSLFTATGKGEYDPFDVLHELGQRGAKAVPAASALLAVDFGEPAALGGKEICYEFFTYLALPSAVSNK